MNESAFDFFDEEITENLVPTEAKPLKVIDSAFTILGDSNEYAHGVQYTFDNIIGDSRNGYAKIRVRTRSKKLFVADYSIEGMENQIAIERKSKADMFGSVANGQKRENFLGRLRKMQETLKNGAVVVECYPQELFTDPPVHTSLSPMSVYQTSISWGLQFPLIHWYWAVNREAAERLTFDILDKFYQHEIDTKYKHHNKPIDSNIEAFQAGIIGRRSGEETELHYSEGNPLRLSFLKGWAWASATFYDGDPGNLWEKGQKPPEAGKKKERKIKPLPDQTSFLPDPKDELSAIMGKLFHESSRDHPVKRPKSKK
jgi:ERCC4-type nuclease